MEKSYKFIENKISERVHGDNDEYMKTNIKICGANVNTNFQGKGMPKEKAPCRCLAIIMLDSIIKVKKVLSSNTFGRMQI